MGNAKSFQQPLPDDPPTYVLSTAFPLPFELSLASRSGEQYVFFYWTSGTAKKGRPFEMGPLGFSVLHSSQTNVFTPSL